MNPTIHQYIVELVLIALLLHSAYELVLWTYSGGH